MFKKHRQKHLKPMKQKSSRHALRQTKDGVETVLGGKADVEKQWKRVLASYADRWQTRCF
jgi:hypothetical protein